MRGGQLAVTQLSDGRLELWVNSPTANLFTAWQQSLDPTQPWTSLTPFLPSPPGSYSSGIFAAHSPNGRVQLWVYDWEARAALSTWQKTSNPSDGWLPWQPFPLPSNGIMLAAGQLEGGRMLLFAGVFGTPNTLWISWKMSTKTDVGWSPWQLFNPQVSPASNVFPIGGLRVGSLSDGRLQAWSMGGPTGSVQDDLPLISSSQTSADPSVPWSRWQTFTQPPIGTFASPNSFIEGLNAAAQLCDDLTRLWLVSDENTLQSIQKASTDPNSGWAAWVRPFVPNPGPVEDVTVGKLADGSCQIWVMTPPASNGSVQILTSRQTSSNPAAWAAWASIGILT